MAKFGIKSRIGRHSMGQGGYGGEEMSQSLIKKSIN